MIIGESVGSDVGANVGILGAVEGVKVLGK